MKRPQVILSIIALLLIGSIFLFDLKTPSILFTFVSTSALILLLVVCILLFKSLIKETYIAFEQRHFVLGGMGLLLFIYWLWRFFR